MMVKPGRSKLIIGDRVYMDAGRDKIELGITDSTYTRRQLKRIVKELTEFLDATAKRRK